jgi:DNA-binding response OmpR family regulator
MNANALLLSRDKQVQIILPSLLSAMRIETEIVTEVLRALVVVSERKFEAIIVDCELNGADTLLKDIDSYPSNRTAVPFAIVPEADVQNGNGLPPGAKFMIAKPVSIEQARRTLDAASSLLIREYRRYFRCALEVPIHLAGTSRELRAKTTNISMGGLAVRTLEEIRLAERFRLEFVLPNAMALKIEGEVVWADTQGRAGMRFAELPELAYGRLQAWLDSKM